MTTHSHDLTVQRAHLSEHRRMLIGRSLAAAAANALPFPVLDEWLTYAILRGTLRKLAQGRQIDLDEEAVRNLIHGKSEPPSLSTLAAGAVGLRLAAKGWRRLFIAYLAARRIQNATRYFTMGTLFDHYCAKLHVGLGLDGEAALDLRLLMDEAIKTTPGGLGRHLFRRGLTAAAKAAVQVPFELAELASKRSLSRLLTRRSSDADSDDNTVPAEVAVAEEVDMALEQQLAREGNLLIRAAAAIEAQFSAEGNAYIDAVIDTFERLWRQRHRP